MYRFKCNMTPETFMSWENRQLRPYRMGRLVRGHGSRIQFKTYRILAPYDRIISQLAAEIEHGEDHDTHESRRRQEYAKRVLDMFATEVERYKGPEDEFYSKILTPILV